MSKKKSVSKKKKAVVIAKSNRVSIGGVYYRGDKNRFIARFTLNGKRVTVGSFLNKSNAVTALNAARRLAMTE